jgi:hypothetical protein
LLGTLLKLTLNWVTELHLEVNSIICIKDVVCFMKVMKHVGTYCYFMTRSHEVLILGGVCWHHVHYNLSVWICIINSYKWIRR